MWPTGVTDHPHTSSEHIKGPFSWLTFHLPSPLNNSDQHGHELPSLSFWRAHLWLCNMQDPSRHHPFYDVSSMFSFVLLPCCISPCSWSGFQWTTWPSISFRRRVSHSLPQGPIIKITYTSFIPSVNVVEGEPDDRPMTTGNHTVRDIYCCKCGTTLGWKYVITSSDFLLAVLILHAGQGVRTVSEVQGRQIYPWT